MVELAVTMTIGAILLVMAVPSFTEYMANSRLREAAHTIQAEALFAQSEAIKRNGIVRLTVTPGSVSIDDMGGAAPVNLRTRTLNALVTADAVVVRFDSNGMPTPFGTASATDLAISTASCSAEIRCPGLRIDAGGAVRICPNKLECS